MTTTSYTVNSNTEIKHKLPEIKTKKSLWRLIKQLYPLNWFNSFSDIEINMDEFSIKKKQKK